MFSTASLSTTTMTSTRRIAASAVRQQLLLRKRDRPRRLLLLAGDDESFLRHRRGTSGSETILARTLLQPSLLTLPWPPPPPTPSLPQEEGRRRSCRSSFEVDVATGAGGIIGLPPLGRLCFSSSSSSFDKNANNKSEERSGSESEAGTSDPSPRPGGTIRRNNNNNRTNVVIYDGVCNLCNGGVNFLARRLVDEDDSEDGNKSDEGLTFCPAQSDAGRRLLDEIGISQRDILDRFAYVDRRGQVHRASTAALEVCVQNDLKGVFFSSAAAAKWPRPLCRMILWCVPAYLRDLVYDVVAKYRYEAFGKTGECQIPPKDVRRRFRT